MYSLLSRPLSPSKENSRVDHSAMFDSLIATFEKDLKTWWLLGFSTAKGPVIGEGELKSQRGSEDTLDLKCGFHYVIDGSLDPGITNRHCVT